MDTTIKDNINIEEEDLQQELKQKKKPGSDNILNELLKYGGQYLSQQINTLINDMFSYHKIQQFSC